MSREIKSIIIMHYDEDGELSVHIAGESAVVLTVDDRTPDDLVFEHLHRESAERILALAPRPWGNSDDDTQAELIESLTTPPTLN